MKRYSKHLRLARHKEDVPLIQAMHCLKSDLRLKGARLRRQLLLLHAEQAHIVARDLQAHIDSLIRISPSRYLNPPKEIAKTWKKLEKIFVRVPIEKQKNTKSRHELYHEYIEEVYQQSKALRSNSHVKSKPKHYILKK